MSKTQVIRPVTNKNIMKKTYRIFLIIIAIQLSVPLKAQRKQKVFNEPIVGKVCPDFIFDQIDFYTKQKVSLKDFKGKWLILDFWNKHCSSCIASLPATSAIQDKFKNDVQFLMVTYDDRNDKINKNVHRSLYKSLHTKLNLSLPGVLDHTSIFRRWNISSCPHIIVVDPMGIVKAISVHINEVQMTEFLGGKNPEMRIPEYADAKETKNNYQYDNKKPLFIDNNGGPDSVFIFRSLLAKWTMGMANYFDDAVNHEIGVIPQWCLEKFHLKQGRYEAPKCPLTHLYLAAYSGVSAIHPEDTTVYGNFWPVPILEIKDSSKFKVDWNLGHGFYSYSLIVPTEDANKPFMMKMMQNDLKYYFGYDVRIEKRKMPYWRIIASEDSKAKLKTKGGITSTKQPFGLWQGLSLTNYPLSNFIRAIRTYADFTDLDDQPLIDETGISGNIDITVQWLKGNLKSVKEALNKNGLDIVHSEKLMDCIVIRDPKLFLPTAN